MFCHVACAAFITWERAHAPVGRHHIIPRMSSSGMVIQMLWLLELVLAYLASVYEVLHPLLLQLGLVL